jgi:hypothetical protein
LILQQEISMNGIDAIRLERHELNINELDEASGGWCLTSLLKQVQQPVTDALEGVANKAIADLGAGLSG